jgi:lipid A disaccharide synthetase
VTSVTAAAICAVILVVPLIVVLAAAVVAFSIVGYVDIVVPVVPHEIEYLRQFKILCVALGNPLSVN